LLPVTAIQRLAQAGDGKSLTFTITASSAEIADSGGGEVYALCGVLS
jgi:hypothetical protein